MPNISCEDFARMVYSVPHELYKSEINFFVSTFWDGGFLVKLGDQLNGFKDAGNLDTWQDACEWLANKACELYPESDFFKWWHRQVDEGRG